jgi:hypothetical protein
VSFFPVGRPSQVVLCDADDLGRSSYVSFFVAGVIS